MTWYVLVLSNSREIRLNGLPKFTVLRSLGIRGELALQSSFVYWMVTMPVLQGLDWKFLLMEKNGKFCVWEKKNKRIVEVK